MILEACVDNIEDALNAEMNGAHQIELCSNLDLDGLTPSRDLIIECKSKLSIPIHAMIRPRGGNFIHTEDEINTMIKEINMCKELEVEGVVFGVLNNDHTINIQAIQRLCEISSPMTITFHKAIDVCSEIEAEVRKLDQLQTIDQLLTSGGQKTAIEGADVLHQLVEMTQNIQIKVAGKVTQDNLEELKTLTGASLFHGKRIV